MTELKEVFEMTTNQIDPDQDAWTEQERRQRRTAHTRKVGAYAVAVAICAAALALFVATRPNDDSTTPAVEPSTVIPADPLALKIADGFFRAYGAHDLARAMTYVADDADLTGLIGADGAFTPGSRKGLRLQLAWNEATGNEQILHSCRATAVGSETVVRCTYDWQGLRSDEMGLGPYRGASLDLIVRDGKIAGTGPGSLPIDRFSPQVWEPFAGWVSSTYPKDAAVMYSDGSFSNFRLSERSIRLWAEHTRQYVKHVNGGTPGT